MDQKLAPTLVQVGEAFDESQIECKYFCDPQTGLLYVDNNTTSSIIDLLLSEARISEDVTITTITKMEWDDRDPDVFRIFRSSNALGLQTDVLKRAPDPDILRMTTRASYDPDFHS
jgi:hypothetical protein